MEAFKAQHFLNFCSVGFFSSLLSQTNKPQVPECIDLMTCLGNYVTSDVTDKIQIHKCIKHAFLDNCPEEYAV